MRKSSFLDLSFVATLAMCVCCVCACSQSKNTGGAASPDPADTAGPSDATSVQDAPAAPDGATTDATAPTDDTGADTSPPVVAGCGATQPGDPCTEEGAECVDKTNWCGSEVTTFGCNCNAGTWQCYAADAPMDCHECCQDANTPWFYCQNGTCKEGAGCKALDCCAPGPNADTGCQGRYGECSACQPDSGYWRCTQCDDG